LLGSGIGFQTPSQVIERTGEYKAKKPLFAVVSAAQITYMNRTLNRLEFSLG
jgi:hypothetical protein